MQKQQTCRVTHSQLKHYAHNKGHSDPVLRLYYKLHIHFIFWRPCIFSPIRGSDLQKLEALAADQHPSRLSSLRLTHTTSRCFTRVAPGFHRFCTVNLRLRVRGSHDCSFSLRHRFRPRLSYHSGMLSVKPRLPLSLSLLPHRESRCICHVGAQRPALAD